MADKKRPEKDGTDTEKGFGTGLRAQLEKRRESSDAHVHKAEVGPNVELRFELTARPREETGDDAGMNALREELAAAQTREAELREALSAQAEAYETAGGPEKDSGRRSGALDDRERKLAEFESQLEAREQRVKAEREAIEDEHRRIAELQAEAAAEQALSAERQEQAEAKLRELKNFDRDRSKVSAELEKRAQALDDREKKLARSEQASDAKERAGVVKLEGRERWQLAKPSGATATRSSRSASASSAPANRT